MYERAISRWFKSRPKIAAQRMEIGAVINGHNRTNILRYMCYTDYNQWRQLLRREMEFSKKGTKPTQCVCWYHLPINGGGAGNGGGALLHTAAENKRIVVYSTQLTNENLSQNKILAKYWL